MKAHALSALAAVLVGQALLCTASGAPIFADDFEGYPFRDGWTAKWNAIDDPQNNGIRTDPSGGDNRVLKLYGTEVWSSAATHAVAFPSDFLVSVKIWNGVEPRALGWGRGSVALEGVTTLATFYANGELHMGDIIVPFETERWYEVGLQYQHNSGNAVAKYWLDGVYQGESPLTVPGAALPTRLELNGGCTAYFDDVRVAAVPEPAGLMIATLAFAGVACAPSLLAKRRSRHVQSAAPRTAVRREVASF